MKIKCRVCDICGRQMGGRDYQCWIRKPRVLIGFPSNEMENCDICYECFRELKRLIINKTKKENDHDN